MNQIVFITGATSGIGAATSHVFAKKGFDLVINGRRVKKLDKLKSKLESKYAVKVKTLPFDVQNKKEVKKAFKSLKGDWQKVDILVNNAGLAKGKDSFEKCNVEDWETMVQTNVMGLLYVSRLVAEQMVKRGKGHIINVCSSAGHEVYPGGNVYCASKFAVDALTKSMRLDLYSKGLKISQVSPGHVEETEFALTRFEGDKQKANIYSDFNPLTSKDVGKAIYYIASQPAHVNIQDIVMFGSMQASNNHIDRSGRKFN